MVFLLDVDEATARRLVENHRDSKNEEQCFAIALIVKRVTVTVSREYEVTGGIVEAVGLCVIAFTGDTGHKAHDQR